MTDETEYPKTAELASELDFWTRIDNELMKAEHIYEDHAYEILTLRRRIASIKMDIRDTMRWRRHDEENERRVNEKEHKDASTTES